MGVLMSDVLRMTAGVLTFPLFLIVGLGYLAVYYSTTDEVYKSMVYAHIVDLRDTWADISGVEL